jgi:hypothetical protein
MIEMGEVEKTKLMYCDARSVLYLKKTILMKGEEKMR